MSTPDARPNPSPDPRAAFVRLSRILLSDQPLATTLTEIAELTRQALPGVAEVSITLLRNDRAESVACTGPVARALDERQYRSGFGPCMDAALGGRIIAVDDTASSPAYPDFARAAQDHGIARSLSIGLPVQRHTLGSLNVYATSDEAFAETAQDLALTFAGFAAVAVADDGAHAGTARLAAGLQHALESRAVIDQAKGVLMGRLRISADRAFELLARQSAQTGRTVRDLAAELVAEAQQPGPDPGPPAGSSPGARDPARGARPALRSSGA